MRNTNSPTSPPKVDKTQIGDHYYMVSYINQGEGKYYLRGIWANSEEECRGKTFDIDNPPEDPKHIIIVEIDLTHAQEIIKRQSPPEAEDPLLTCAKKALEESK